MVIWQKECIAGGKRIQGTQENLHQDIEGLLRNPSHSVVIQKIRDPGTLDEQAIDQLVFAARDGFGSRMSRNEVLVHIFEGKILHVFSMDKQLVGFASYSLLDMDIGPEGSKTRITNLYLNGIVMQKECQGTKLGAYSLSEAIKDHTSDVLTLRTQNPAMYSAVKKVAKAIGLEHRLFPSIDGYEDNRAKEIAEKVSRALNEKNYDSSRFFDAGTYGRPLNDSVPKTDEHIEMLFEKIGINRNAGDSIIVVAMLRP